MSHWNNFPACSFMTDFKIVVVSNERVQPERESLEQEELNAQPYNQLQDPHGIKQQQQISDTSDNPLLVNVLSNLGPEPFPDPLTPIRTAPTAYTLVQVTPPQPQVELSKVDKSTTDISTNTTDVNNITNNNQHQPQTVSNSTALDQSLGNDSSSSGTYQSFTNELQENNSLVGHILFRSNDTEIHNLYQQMERPKKNKNNFNLKQSDQDSIAKRTMNSLFPMLVKIIPEKSEYRINYGKDGAKISV